MNETTPDDDALRVTAAIKRAEALLILERTHPYSLLGQQFVIWMLLLMVMVVAATSMLRPTVDSSPYLAILLALVVGAIAGHVMRVQRRLEALIALAKSELS